MSKPIRTLGQTLEEALISERDHHQAMTDQCLKNFDRAVRMSNHVGYKRAVQETLEWIELTPTLPDDKTKRTIISRIKLMEPHLNEQ